MTDTLDKIRKLRENRRTEQQSGEQLERIQMLRMLESEGTQSSYLIPATPYTGQSVHPLLGKQRRETVETRRTDLAAKAPDRSRVNRGQTAAAKRSAPGEETDSVRRYLLDFGTGPDSRTTPPVIADRKQENALPTVEQLRTAAQLRAALEAEESPAEKPAGLTPVNPLRGTGGIEEFAEELKKTGAFDHNAAFHAFQNAAQKPGEEWTLRQEWGLQEKEPEKAPVFPEFQRTDLTPGTEAVPGVDTIPYGASRLGARWNAGDYLKAAGNAAWGTMSTLSNSIVNTVKAVDSLAAQGFSALTGHETGPVLKPVYDFYESLDADTQKKVEEDIQAGRMNGMVYNLLSGLVQQIPTIAIGLLTGGTSAAGQAAGAVSSNSSALAAGIKQLPELFKNPQFLWSFIQSFGGTYGDAVKNGANPAQAFLAGVVDALPESAIEVGGGLESAMAEGPVTSWKDFAKRWIRSAAEEAGEEIRQDPFSGLARMTYDPDMTIFSLTDQEAVLNPVRAAESAAAAFLTTLISGGVGTGVRSYQAIQDAGRQVIDSGNTNTLLSAALDSADGTIRSRAVQLIQRQMEGKEPSVTDVGRLAWDAANAQNASRIGLEPEKPPKQVENRTASMGVRQNETAAAAEPEAVKLKPPPVKTAKPQADGAAGEPVSVSMAERLGESGKMAYQYTLEHSGIEEDGMRPAFLAYYHYGLAGSDIKNVPSEFGMVLDPESAQRAWYAGQNDAESSLRQERQAARYAPVDGDGSGLVYDDFVKEAVASGRTAVDVNQEERVYLSAETANRINEVAKALGVRVQFADSVREGTANAQISGSAILVEKNNPNPVMAVIGHEFTHRMQELAPEEYRAFRSGALEGRESRVQERIDLYAAHGVELRYEQAMDEVAADYAGLMMDGGKVLDQFIQKHRADRTLLQKVRDAIRSFIDKLTGRERQRAQTAEGKLTAALNAAAREAKALQDKAGRDTMDVVKHSLKEDGVDGRENETRRGTETGSQEGYEKTSDREGEERNRRVRGELPPTSGRYGGVNPTFGDKPYHSWVEGHVIEPTAGTVTHSEQQTAVEYGVPSFAVSDDVWSKSNVDASAFSTHGQIYFRETMPESYQGMAAPHEVTHVMRQVEFAPYLDFVERTPTMLNMGNVFTQKLLEHIAAHQHTTVMEADPTRLYDELNATIYGHICSGKMDGLIEPLRHVFHDFDAYAKELTEIHQRFKAENSEGKTKFSLKSPIEETRDLLALHNLTEEKLWGDLRLGGFPMPSIAVTRTDVPHTNFGDITLVMDKRSIDPKADRKNTVYSADAWTPTFPQVEYAADPAAERRISGRLQELSGKVDGMFKQDLYRVTYDMEDLLNRHGGEEGLLRQLMDNYGLKAAYLEDAGRHVSATTVQREADKGYSQDRVEKYGAIIEALGTDDPDEIGHIPMKELRDRYGDKLEAAFPGMTKSPLRLSGVIRQVQAYLRDQGGEAVYETVTDAAATRRAIDDALDRDGYEQWVRELYSGIQADSGIYNNKERFTPAGNRRTFQQTHYPVTLENIVKAMKGQNGGNTKNVSGFYGVKSLRAGTAKRFKSIADMHKLEGRLQNLTEEQTKAIHEELDRRLMDITEALAEKSPNGKGTFDYYLADSIGNMLVEIADGEVYTIDAIMGKFNGEYGFHIGNELAAQVRDLLFDVSQMPVNIFEAKPERAVGFDEVLAAVIPSSASEELRDALSERGVNVFTYKAGDDTDRLAKVNSVENAKFSLKAGTVSKSYEAVLEENDLLKEQMKDYRALRRQNERLRESRDYWRGQTRITEEASTDRKAVAAAAKQLLQSYSSEADAGDIQKRLQGLYDFIASGYDGENELSYDEARRRAEDIARTVVENAAARESLGESYQELLDYLKTTKIVFGKELQRNIPDYNSFQKRQFGRLNLTGQGRTNIDQIYKELSEQWPEFFDEQEQIHPEDQLFRIAKVLDLLHSIAEYNPFEGEMDQAVAGAANEILESFFDLPQTRETFADRQAAKLNAAKAKGKQQVHEVREAYKARLDTLRQQNRQRVADTIDKERAKRDQKIQDLKDRYAARDEAGRERRTARELRNKITRHANALSQKLLRPSDRRHIPEELRGPVAKMLESINQESLYGIDENGKRVKNGGSIPVGRTKAFRALKEQYARIAAEGGDMVIDPSLLGSDADGIQGSFDAVIAMENIRLADMSVEQLQTVWQVVKAVEHSVSTAGRLLSQSKYERTADWADALSADTASRRKKGSLTRGHISLDLENPYTFFSHYGEAGKAIFRMLRNAQDQEQLMKIRVAEETRKIVDGKTLRELEKNARTFTTEQGESLTLTTAQVMELYELAKRGQARDHLLIGGVVQPEVKSERIRRGTDSVRLSEADLAVITGTLSAEEKQIADQLQGLTAGMLADYGNRASMAAYGYKKFTGKDYWPIHSAKEELHSSIEKNQSRTRSIRNIGMAQSTVPHANNSLNLPGIFTTFANHVSDMTKYAAWLCTMEDMDRLFNYNFRDEVGNRTGRTVKGLLDRVGGPGSQKYWHNLMEDIQNGIESSDDSPVWNFVGKTVGNLKGAAVKGNERVVLQQPTAFFKAALELEARDMSRGILRGATKGNGWEKALKYSPIALIKDEGSFDISNPRQMKETLFDSRTLRQRASDAASAPAGKADSITWGKLWNACEWAVAREHKDLARGSEAFYQETARRFAEVIDQTQVVDGVLQRANIMRSSNETVKQATSFMGEPIMALNILMRTYDQARYETDPVKRKKAVKKMGRAVVALVVTDVVNALVVSLVDAKRDDDPDKDFVEKYRTALLGDYDHEGTVWDNIRAGLSANLVENLNPLARIPFLKDWLSQFQGYEVKRMDTQSIAELFDVSRKWEKLGSGRYTAAYLLKETAGSLSKVFGLSIGNIMRDLSATINTGISIADSFGADTVELRYRLSKTMYDLKNSQNLGIFAALIWEARQNGNEELAAGIYNDLGRSGWTKEQLDRRVNNLAQKAEGGAELARQYVDAEERGNASAMEKAAEAAGDRGFSKEEFKSMLNKERNRRKDDYQEAEPWEDIGPGYWSGGEAVYSYDTLYQAVLNGDTSSEAAIREALEADGKNSKNIDSAVKTRLRADLKEAFWESGSLNDDDVKNLSQLLSDWDPDEDVEDYLEEATLDKFKSSYKKGKGDYAEYRKYYDILKNVFGRTNDYITREGMAG